jgi:hypothetical protein
MEITVITDNPQEELSRSVTLTNDEWLVLSQCVESFTESYRAKHSQTIATYVTRGQLTEAQDEAKRMNQLLMKLDKLQARIV